MCSIRLATVNDAPFLPSVEASAGQAFKALEKYQWIAEGEGQTEQDHLAFIEQQLEWVAVNANDEPIGFINVDRHDGSLHICELSVCQNHQGKGIGKQLIRQVFMAALAQNRSSVTLTTFRDVPWNAPYYQRLGFSIIEDSALTPTLHAILQEEVEAGFQAEDRCAMVITIAN